MTRRRRAGIFASNYTMKTMYRTTVTNTRIAASALLMFLATTASAIDYASLHVPVEVRAVWLNANAIPKNPAETRRLLASYKNANINLIFPEVVTRGYAVYESSYLPRDPRFANAPDPLPALIRLAHAYGIEVHPWVWVFRAGYTADRGGILTAHPEWTELSIDGKDLSPGGGLWISPAIPAAREFLAAILAEVVRNYDVDGLHLDYIRYESQSWAPYGYSPQSVGLFRRQYGFHPADAEPFSLEQFFWNKFRERQINTFVQQIARQTRTLKPHVLLSAAVDPNINNARADRLQNWANWLDNKWLDFVVPMAYSSRDDYFRRLLEIVSTSAAGRSLVVSGIAPYRHDGTEQTIRQIALARQILPGGQALFSASAIKRELLSALRSGPYALPAALPFRDTQRRISFLRSYSEHLKRQGKAAEADYIFRSADRLASCLDYQESEMQYVPPTPPPVRVVENAAPLPEVAVKAATKPPVIDGRISEDEWSCSSRVVLANGLQGEDAVVSTEALLCRDKSNIYIAFRCEEPAMSRIRTAASGHDGAVFLDDSVEVFLKPPHSRKDHFHFAVNAVGSTFDEKNTDSQWNTEWTAMSNIGAESYTVELRIPVSAFGEFPSIEGSMWKANLARNRTVTGEMQTFVWSVPYGTLHNPDRFGRLQFE